MIRPPPVLSQQNLRHGPRHFDGAEEIHSQDPLGFMVRKCGQDAHTRDRGIVHQAVESVLAGPRDGILHEAIDLRRDADLTRRPKEPLTIVGVDRHFLDEGGLAAAASGDTVSVGEQSPHDRFTEAAAPTRDDHMVPRRHRSGFLARVTHRNLRHDADAPWRLV